jgi:hypothetical protein
MQQNATACPNCGAPLNTEGVCASCGATARGFYKGQDLGALAHARALEQGLDYYLLLQVDEAASASEVQTAYWQLRQHFPHDMRRLVLAQRRRLELIEQAYTVLGNPASRRAYDELRRQLREEG